MGTLLQPNTNSALAQIEVFDPEEATDRLALDASCSRSGRRLRSEMRRRPGGLVRPAAAVSQIDQPQLSDSTSHLMAHCLPSSNFALPVLPL